MHKRLISAGLLAISGIWVDFLVPNLAPGSTQPAPPSAMTKDAGNPTQIVGQGKWSTLDIGLEYTHPVVVLLDQGGVYAARDGSFFAPDEGQIFGKFTSSFANPPFGYTISLPPVPKGTLYDVDQNGRKDVGVQIWTVEVVNNFTTYPKDPHLLPLEQPLSLTPVSSLVTRPPTGVAGIREPLSGKLVIYAPEAGQGFPTGFGTDGKLFTQDDPIATLPQGYTVVTLDPKGFKFERSPQVTIDLTERPARTKSDFSQMGYVEAFNALIDEFKTRYAYTDLRKIDWEVWRTRYLPQVQAAATKQDAGAFLRVFLDLSRAMRDGHVQVLVSSLLMASPSDPGSDSKAFDAAVGLEVVELSDGRVLVKRVMPKSPAAKAGIKPLAVITAINNEAIANRITRLSESSHFSTPTNRRLEGVDRAVKFAKGEKVQIRYQNLGQPAKTANLKAVYGLGNNFSLFGLLPETSFRKLRSPRNRAYGYVTWAEFLQPGLQLSDFARFIQQSKQHQLPGIIIDLRTNVGGSSGLTLFLLSYFWSAQQPLRVNKTVSEIFDPTMGKFLTSPFFEVPPAFPIYAPGPEYFYNGKVVVLIGESCASACEFFADVMQRYGRARLIGIHPSAGLGGAIQNVALPEGIEITYTYTRELDLQGRPYIEARGVQPDILVPINEAYVRMELQGRDPLLNAAIDYLDSNLAR